MNPIIQFPQRPEPPLPQCVYCGEPPTTMMPICDLCAVVDSRLVEFLQSPKAREVTLKIILSYEA